MFNLNRFEEKMFLNLKTPALVQDFLNRLAPNKEQKGETCMSPRQVLKKRTAHCAEAALLAAAVFKFHGRKPWLLDLETTKNDLEHVVALFRERGLWGAVSKSNHAVLRYREPVYRSVRELVMSYFHEYYLDDGKKTLRSFSDPFNLNAYDDSWIIADFDLWSILDDLDKSKHYKILPKKLKMRKVDKIEIKAGLLTEW